MTTADFDSDGRPDLGVAHRGTFSVETSVLVLLNTTPAGSASPGFHVERFELPQSPTGVAAGDLNGDGRADLAFPFVPGDVVAVFLNLAAGGIGQTIVSATSVDPGDTITVGAEGVNAPNSAYRLKFGSTAEGCPTSPYVLGGNVVATGRTINPVSRTIPTNATSGVRWLCWVRIDNPEDHTVPVRITVF